MPNNIRCMKAIIAIALLPLLLLSAQVFGQSGGSVRGTVMDASQAVLPGASITAINVDTGVETKATTNNAGVYNFPSLQSGTYNIVAEAAGFLRATTTDVRVRLDAVNLNFNMVVAGGSETVEVTGTAENMNLDAGSSTGTVIQEDIVTNLPILTGNVLDLVNIMGGVVQTENPLFDAGGTTFAGVPATSINIQRDGISVNEIRYNSGIATPSRMNTEMVGELKMVLSPVDAEMGRGAGQIQMTTRSGANAFHGSAVWNIQNSALDSREWEEKARGQINAADWRNVNNYTLSLSGPIVKNKTFFFVTWDHQLAKTRSSANVTVLTPCARKGIYRYLDGVGMGQAGVVPGRPTYRGITEGQDDNGDDIIHPAWYATRPATDLSGVPLEDYTWPVNDNAQTGYNVPLPDGMVGSALNLSGARERDVFGPNTGRLVYQSVLGTLTDAERIALGGAARPDGVVGYAQAGSSVYTDCSAYTINPGYAVGTQWDTYRRDYDPSGFIQKFSDPNYMPLPNDYFQVGDGLNTAGYRWTRTASGQDTVFGTMYDSNRKSITTKIDHNVNASHRLSGTYSYESNYGDDTGNLPMIPTGYGGATDRKPQSFTVSLTSTLRPTLLNEFRVGLSRTRTHTNNSLTNPKTGNDVRKALLELLPTGGAGWNYSDVVLAGPGGTISGLPYFWGSGITSTWGGVDPRWSFNDTLTWMKGAHSFKGGFEYRQNQSKQDQNGDAQFSATNTFPRVVGGTNGRYPVPYGSAGGNGPLSGMYGDDWSATLAEYNRDCDRGNGCDIGTAGQYTGGYNLLYYMRGSVTSINEYFYATDAKNPRWNRPGDGELTYETDLRGREFSFFFKDDWKLTSSLTLNLGMRYEYYGAPWVSSGLAAGIKDDINGMYGISRNLDAWMPDLATLKAQGVPDYAGLGTQQIYIGPNSPNPDIPVFKKDANNFAPHVGFAWQLPWLGKGKTTMRGGYSISYSAIGNYDNNFGYAAYLSHQPGMDRVYNYSGSTGCTDVIAGVCDPRFSNLNQLLPLNPAQSYPTGDPNNPYTIARYPLGHSNYVVSPEYQGGGITIYDPNIRNPYVQNLNLSITRSIGNALTLDVRYVGTLSRKSISGLSLNTINYVNNGLFGEFAKLRTGGYNLKSIEDFPILNSGWIPYKGDPNGSLNASLYAPILNSKLVNDLSGAEQVLYNSWTDIATGRFSTIASGLQTANYAANLTGTQYGGTIDPNDPRVLLPTGMSDGQVLRKGLAGAYTDIPVNMLVTNPQYSPTIQRNQGRSNYHSMQVQMTMRPIRGLSFQTTYTWSRSLARGSVLDWTDPDWTMDYGLSGSHRSHQLNSYGTYELPFGARGFFFRNASGAVKKAIEGWQISWIATATSGLPMSVGNASATQWGTAKWVQVNEFDTKDVTVRWNPVNATGTYFNKTYGGIYDPACESALVGSNVRNPYATGTNTLTYACQNGGGGFTTGLVALAQDPGTADEKIIFQNAAPGEIGNVQNNILAGPGRWSLDMNMAKSIEFMEGKRIEFRIDAQNIFNHASPSYDLNAYGGIFAGLGASSFGSRNKQVVNPNATVALQSAGSPAFGYMNSKAGHRTFQAKIRISF